MKILFITLSSSPMMTESPEVLFTVNSQCTFLLTLLYIYLNGFHAQLAAWNIIGAAQRTQLNIYDVITFLFGNLWLRVFVACKVSGIDEVSLSYSIQINWVHSQFQLTHCKYSLWASCVPYQWDEYASCERSFFKFEMIKTYVGDQFIITGHMNCRMSWVNLKKF